MVSILSMTNTKISSICASFFNASSGMTSFFNISNMSLTLHPLNSLVNTLIVKVFNRCKANWVLFMTNQNGYPARVSVVFFVSITTIAEMYSRVQRSCNHSKHFIKVIIQNLRKAVIRTTKGVHFAYRNWWQGSRCSARRCLCRGRPNEGQQLKEQSNHCRHSLVNCYRYKPNIAYLGLNFWPFCLQ